MTMNEPESPRDERDVDWSLTTWEGARREQMRRWAELPLERAIMALEEMESLSQNLQDAPSGVAEARESVATYGRDTKSAGLELSGCALTTLPLEGLHTGSLGHYLAALGLLRVTEKMNIRGYWENGRLVLRGQTEDLSEESLCKYLVEAWNPSPLERWWGKVQEASKKDPDAIPRERAFTSDERVDQLDAVMVQANRRVFNDLFLRGGIVGKRNLASVHEKCCRLAGKLTAADLKVKKSKKAAEGKDNQSDLTTWLRHTLFGDENVELPELLGAGTWFVFSNKTFNSGQEWYKDGHLSPWSFLLAVEGALLLRGGVHRRLGTIAKGKAVFPFMSRPTAPPTVGQVAYGTSEFWAPLWGKPASIREVEALFRSGVAEIGGRPAAAPHEFAVAAMDSAVDAGVSAFVRFELCQTTSARVYEALPRDLISVRQQGGMASHSRLLLPLITKRWIDRLPFEPRDQKQRGKFVGLRGPVEAAIVHLSADPDDPERWRSLLSLIARTQQRIDRNKKLRKQCTPVPRLSRGWFDRGWPEPSPELVVARAIASIHGPVLSGRSVSGHLDPLLVNIFGVAMKGRKVLPFPDARPTRAVWHEGSPTRSLIDLLRRRLLDASELDPAPIGGARPCGISTAALYLAGGPWFDDELLARWLPALTLIDWSGYHSRSSERAVVPDVPVPPLYSLFRPLFDPDNIRVSGKQIFSFSQSDSRMPHSASLRAIVNLLLQSQIDEAVAHARRRYLGAGWRIFDPPKGEIAIDGERLVAALLIPVDADEVASRFRTDWLLPSKERQ